MQIIILAAGKGTRMNSDLPKVLVPLLGKPLIVRLLDNLLAFADEQKIIVTGFKRDLVEKTLGSRFSYASQKEQLGTANAVLAAKPFVTAENVIVLYGDMPFIQKESLEELIELHSINKSKFSMFTTSVPNFDDQFEAFINFGRIVRDPAGQILKITESKFATEEEKKITELNPGIYMFQSRWLWDHIGKIKQNVSGEYYLTDIVEVAIAEELHIFTAQIDPMEVYGVNTQEQLRVAETLI